MCRQLKPENYEELFSNTIWYTPLISNDPFFMPNLYKKGINTIGDVLHNGGIITKQELIIKTYLITINELHYLRLKILIKQFMKTYNFEPIYVPKPQAPIYYKLATKYHKGSKIFITY